VIVSGKFLAELLRRENGGVDRSAKAFFSLAEGRGEISQRCLSGQKQVDVALGRLFAASDRPVDERHGKALGESPQLAAQHVDQSYGLNKQSSEFR
jgi:hypothetical protein